MSKLIELLKSNLKVIMFTVLVYQIILTIFFYSTENLIILAIFFIIASASIIIGTYKDDIQAFFKRK